MLDWLTQPADWFLRAPARCGQAPTRSNFVGARPVDRPASPRLVDSRQRAAINQGSSGHRTSEENAMNRYATIALPVLVGAAIGAAAIHLHAQAKKLPAFTIAEITIKEQDGYEKEFLPAIVQSVREKRGNFIIRDGHTETLLGSRPAERVTSCDLPDILARTDWA
jgi:uncharacterized protein (DUF1330 family)